MSNKVEQLHQQLRERILVLDGGMGTMIQGYRLSEQDFRGERFADWPCDLKGNNDLLVLSKPEVIREIHDAYFAAGADIIETNTFNSTTIAMADYQMESLSAEINFAAAKLARASADAWTARTPEKPRYAGGSARADQPHRFYFSGRQRSGISEYHVRSAGGRLS